MNYLFYLYHRKMQAQGYGYSMCKFITRILLIFNPNLPFRPVSVSTLFFLPVCEHQHIAALVVIFFYPILLIVWYPDLLGFPVTFWDIIGSSYNGCRSRCLWDNCRSFGDSGRFRFRNGFIVDGGRNIVNRRRIIFYITRASGNPISIISISAGITSVASIVQPFMVFSM